MKYRTLVNYCIVLYRRYREELYRIIYCATVYSKTLIDDALYSPYNHFYLMINLFFYSAASDGGYVLLTLPLGTPPRVFQEVSREAYVLFVLPTSSKFYP